GRPAVRRLPGRCAEGVLDTEGTDGHLGQRPVRGGRQQVGERTPEFTGEALTGGVPRPVRRGSPAAGPGGRGGSGSGPRSRGGSGSGPRSRGGSGSGHRSGRGPGTSRGSGCGSGPRPG